MYKYSYIYMYVSIWKYINSVTMVYLLNTIEAESKIKMACCLASVDNIGRGGGVGAVLVTAVTVLLRPTM